MVTSHLYGQLKAVATARPRRPAAILGDDVRTRPVSTVLAAATAVVVAATLAACGGDATVTAAGAPTTALQPVDRLERHPRAIDPSAGVPTGSAGVVARQDAALPEPRSDAEIRRELAASGIPAGSAAGLTSEGLAVAPLGAPPVVQAVIQAGNQIAHLPYRYGGGHATWIDTAYDCSASISFAFAAAGLVSSPMVSGDLAQWGEPGPGQWITVYANGGHTFMFVAGLRFDTSGLSATGSRWQAATRATAGFAVRHPPGL
jgi:cell wall-associated NlpC family hydrolase